MTTRRMLTRYESIAEWPAFTDRRSTCDIGVASLEIHRRPHDVMMDAVAEASTVLRSAFGRLPSPRQYKWWLLCLGRSISSSSRVTAYIAEKDGLWAAMEKSEVDLPGGPRAEVKVAYENGSFGFAGSIQFEPDDLAAALEVTRVAHAICVGAEAYASDPTNGLVSPLSEPVESKLSLLSHALELIPDYTFLARGFGDFDDAVVGVEVFAAGRFLSLLIPALQMSLTHADLQRE